MQRISNLILKKLTGQLTPAEETELMTWVAENDKNEQLYRRLTDPMTIKHSLDLWEMTDSRRHCRDMQRQVNAIMWRTRLKRLTAAAAILAAVIGIGALLISRMDMSLDVTPDMASAVAPVTTEDIKPGTIRAVLSDASGHNVVLNAADTARVTATLLDLRASSATDSVVHELCLDVPRGGEFNCVQAHFAGKRTYLCRNPVLRPAPRLFPKPLF